MVFCTAVTLSKAASTGSFLDGLLSPFSGRQSAHPTFTFNPFANVFNMHQVHRNQMWKVTRAPTRQQTKYTHNFGLFTTRPTVRRPVIHFPEDIELIGSTFPFRHRYTDNNGRNSMYENARSILAVPLRQCSSGERLQNGKCKKIYRTSRRS